MATFGEIQTRVQQIIIDLPTAVTAQVPTLIRGSLRRLQRAHDFKVCEALSSVYTTTLETRVLAAVPSNFHKFRGLPQLIDANGVVREMGIFPDRGAAEREFSSLAGGEATASDISGTPRFLLRSEPTDELGATNFEVYPLPTDNSLYTDGNWRIRIPYWKFLTELSGNSDTNWFTINADDFLAWDAAADGFFLDWDEQRALIWKQNASAKFKEAVDLDKKMRVSGLNVLVPSSDALAPRGIQGDNTTMRFFRPWSM